MSDVISGMVRTVNVNGLQLEGRDGWVNFSKYAESLEKPNRGDMVNLTLDKSGYIRQCHVLAVQQGGSTPANNGQSGPGPSPTTRDRTISRLAILKAAAEFSANRTEIKSGDVLKIAASWERWVNASDNSQELVADLAAETDPEVEAW